MVTFNEHIPDIGVFNLTLSHLNLGTALVLQAPNCLALFANDKADGVVGYWNDVGGRRWCSIRRHHAVIERGRWQDRCRIVQLLGDY